MNVTFRTQGTQGYDDVRDQLSMAGYKGKNSHWHAEANGAGEIAVYLLDEQAEIDIYFGSISGDIVGFRGVLDHELKIPFDIVRKCAKVAEVVTPKKRMSPSEFDVLVDGLWKKKNGI